jgi:hypothetical protein
MLYVPIPFIIFGLFVLIQLCMFAIWAGGSQLAPVWRMLSVAIAGVVISELFGDIIVAFLPTIAAISLLKLAGFRFTQGRRPSPATERRWQFSLRALLGWMTGSAILLASFRFHGNGHGPTFDPDDPGFCLFAVVLAAVCVAAVFVALGEQRTVTRLAILAVLMVLPVAAQAFYDWPGNPLRRPPFRQPAPLYAYLIYLLMIALGLGELCIVRGRGFRWTRIAATPTADKPA